MSPVFISYSHRDSEYAHNLADAMRAEGFDVWIDARIDYGSQWPHEIQKQLDACEAFILVMTPRSFASEWVQSELQRAKRKLKPVFPLLLEGDEPWLSVESTQFYDVRGGKLPDAKFYSALGRLAARHAGQAVQLPADPLRKSDPSKASVRSAKLRNKTIIAVLGTVVALLAVGIPFVWSDLTKNFTPAQIGNATSPVSSGSDEVLDSSDFVDPEGVPMRLIPAGEFTMGGSAEAALAECQKSSSDCDRSWFEDEEPPHTVSLDSFYIDLYEVTNALYADCVDVGQCQPPVETASDTRSSYYGNPEYEHFPVIYVDWDMAQTYCQWRGGRLPTEAEWERAARGDDGRIYPWGNEIDSSYLNYNQDIGDTVEAGNYDAGRSPYGLYDMAGNVWEWVADYYSDTYYQDAPFSNPPGPDSGQGHVLRGGSWYDAAYLIRTTVRLKEPNPVDNNFGFRCARDAAP